MGRFHLNRNDILRQWVFYGFQNFENRWWGIHNILLKTILISFCLMIFKYKVYECCICNLASPYPCTTWSNKGDKPSFILLLEHAFLNWNVSILCSWTQQRSKPRSNEMLHAWGRFSNYKLITSISCLCFLTQWHCRKLWISHLILIPP